MATPERTPFLADEGAGMVLVEFDAHTPVDVVLGDLVTALRRTGLKLESAIVDGVLAYPRRVAPALDGPGRWEVRIRPEGSALVRADAVERFLHRARRYLPPLGGVTFRRAGRGGSPAATPLRRPLTPRPRSSWPARPRRAYGPEDWDA